MEYLFSVFWKTHKIGNVFKEDKTYYYCYDQKGVCDAQKEGFDYIVGFPDINKVYTNDTLFPFFRYRIMSQQRHTEEEKKAVLDSVTRLLQNEGELFTDSYKMIKERKK